MPEPQWVKHNGMYVPEGVSLAKRMEAAEQAKVARGRFFSHLAMTQNGATYGLTKPQDQVSFEYLRQARQKSLIDRIIINARQLQAKYVGKRVHVPGKEIGFRVVHKNHADPNYKPTRDVLQRCKEMEEIIDNVNPRVHPNGFSDLMMISIGDELTFDRKAMVVYPDRTGKPVMYHVVDGTTIRPILEVLLAYMQRKKIKSQDQALGLFYREHGLDLTNAAYVQIVEGLPVATWTEDQMSIHIANPTVEINKWAYGEGSMLEKSIAGTITWMNAWSYNDGLFNQDSPESLLFLYGDYDPIGLGAFQRQVLDQSGSGDYQKIPVIPADSDFKAELVKIRELPKDVQFAEFMRMIIQIKTAAYRSHPSIVNFSMDKGGTSGGLSIGDQNEDEILKRAHEEGFIALIESFSQWLTRTLIKPRYDDLVLIFDVDKEDEAKRIELIGQQLKTGMTFNEARQAQGLVGKLPYGDVPDSTVYAQVMNTQMQAQVGQQQQEAQQDHQAGMQQAQNEHQSGMEEGKQQFQADQTQKQQQFQEKQFKQQKLFEGRQNNKKPGKPLGKSTGGDEKFLVLEIIG